MWALVIRHNVTVWTACKRQVHVQMGKSASETLSALQQTVNGHFYVQVLKRLRDAVQRKRCNKWQGEWFLHHDNAPSHTLLVVQQFLAQKSIPIITRTPYSLDFAPSDFWLFSTLKMGLKGKHFATMGDIKSNAMAKLRKIPKEAFCQCFRQWQNWWSKCVCGQRSYFEGD